jgi:hypothetical protein
MERDGGTAVTKEQHSGAASTSHYIGQTYALMVNQIEALGCHRLGRVCGSSEKPMKIWLIIPQKVGPPRG